MCTAGFWKDKNGNRIYFKNRDNLYKHKNERCEVSDKGLFIRDDNGKYEGMNKHHVFIVELTLLPPFENQEPSDRYTKDALTETTTAKQALDFLMTASRKHNFAASFIIGDKDTTYLLEAACGTCAWADLTEASYFVETNNGQLLLDRAVTSVVINPTRARLAAAMEMIKKVQSVADIKKMLAYHNGDSSICRHCDDGSSIYTQSSYIFYPFADKAEVIIGNTPCNAEYETVLLPK